MELSSILFDLDGTLVDTLPGIDYSCRAAVQAVLPNRKLENLRQRMGPPIREIFRQAFSSVEPIVLNQLEAQFRANYDTVGWQKSIAYPSVAETLAQLNDWHINCFVVTNKPSVPTERILSHLGLSKYIKEVTAPDSSSGTFSSKASAIKYLLSKYQLASEHTVVVGDSADDARAAQACHLRFVAVSYGYSASTNEWLGNGEHAQVISEFSQVLKYVIDESSPISKL